MRSSYLRVIALLGASLVIPSSADAQNDALASKINALLEHFEANHKFMGAVAVSQDGQIVVQQQYGMDAAGTESSKRPDAETQYRIGSITKIFTAVMIMQLVEEEKLSLDGKLAEFFPDLASADEISIRQMLGHQSGIGSITDDPTYRSWNQDAMTREKMIEIISRQPTKFEPGAKTEYSNSIQRYIGIYARKDFPLKITVTVKDGKLVAQGSGQPSFSLTSSSETEFRSDVVGATMAFSQSSADSGFDTMALKQGGQNLEFRKE